jgi:hypothetical protein
MRNLLICSEPSGTRTQDPELKGGGLKFLAQQGHGETPGSVSSS